MYSRQEYFKEMQQGNFPLPETEQIISDPDDLNYWVWNVLQTSFFPLHTYGLIKFLD